MLQRKCLASNRGLFASAKMFGLKQRSVLLQRRCLALNRGLFCFSENVWPQTEVCFASAKLFGLKQRSVLLQRKCLALNRPLIGSADVRGAFGGSKTAMRKMEWGMAPVMLLRFLFLTGGKGAKQSRPLPKQGSEPGAWPNLPTSAEASLFVIV